MGLHQAPLPPSTPEASEAHPAHLHIHFYPPLLRSSSVRKFLVGFEMMAESQVSGLFLPSLPIVRLPLLTWHSLVILRPGSEISHLSRPLKG